MGTGRDAHDADYAPAVPAGSNAPPVAMIWAYCIRIFNDGGSDLEFTFDGTNVQGVVKAGKFAEYLGRHEAGVAVRGAGGTSFRIEAW